MGVCRGCPPSEEEVPNRAHSRGLHCKQGLLRAADERWTEKLPRMQRLKRGFRKLAVVIFVFSVDAAAEPVPARIEVNVVLEKQNLPAAAAADNLRKLLAYR